MAGIEGLGNLRKSTVRPLRPTARTQPGEVVQTFDVSKLKNGGSLDFGGVMDSGGNSGGEPGGAERPLLRGERPAPRARNSYKSKLPIEEQVEELSKIHKSAVDYEAVLLDQLVKQMRQSPLAKTPGGDTFSDIAEQPFRDFLSRAGGLGLADDMTAQVARQQGLEQTLQDYPEVMGPGWRPTIPPNLMKKSPGGLEMAPDNPPRPLSESGGETPAAENGAAASTAPSVETTPAAPEKTEKAAPGLMSREEIAWLYNDAVDGLA